MAIQQEKVKHLEHIISPRYDKLFGIHKKLLPDIKKEIIAMYSSTTPKSLLFPENIHSTILKIFTNIYYPEISHNLHVDRYNAAVIMGGVAFNQNIPNKLAGFLTTETDDIDLKIYTTDINPFNKDKPRSYQQTMSLFKFTSLISAMFLKQILTYMINLEDEIFEQHKASTTLPLMQNKNIPHKSKSRKAKLSGKGKKTVKHLGGSILQNKGELLSHKVKFYGILKKFRVIIEIKFHNGTKESHDLTELNYNEIAALLFPKINDPDLLITTKAQYGIVYSKLIKPAHKRNKITFSDCKIIYPSVDYPSFYTYYLLNNKKAHSKTLEQLATKSHLTLADVIETKSCKNNCKYISVKSLMIDIVLMLSYAELLQYDNFDLLDSGDTTAININKIIQVKIGCIFKYYKYLIKYIRLHIIKKFYDSTLNKTFVESCKRLIRYANNLKKDTEMDELHTKNIEYRKLLRDFHMRFFMLGELQRLEFPELDELGDTYRHIVKHLNMSRALFKDLNEVSQDSGIESQDSIMILLAAQKMAEELQSGGALIKAITPITPIILHENYDYDDMELDNEPTLSNDRAIIMRKINKMMKNELSVLDSISNSIS